MRRLGTAIAELAAVEDLQALTETITTHGAIAIGARTASLSVIDRKANSLMMIGVSGSRPDTRKRWAKYSLSSATPAAHALREHRPVFVSGRAAIEQRYPDLAGQVVVDGCLICLPLTAGGRDVGVVSLSVPGTWTPDAEELGYLGILADTCAQALERIQARAAAADASVQLEFLVAASAELASSLDYQATLAKVPALAVPAVADWCSIAILDDGTLRTLAVADGGSTAAGLRQRDLPEPLATEAPMQVVRNAASQLFEELPDELLVEGSRDEEQLRRLRSLKPRSALLVPLLARGRRLGVITLLSADSGRDYRASDLRFAEDLARRAAVAIDNAHLHSETREVALRLQRAVLPGSIEVEGWEIAEYYRPAGRAEVGGDLYDVVPLPDGRVVLIIGDVMGRGVSAAAAAAQMRAAIHAYIATDPDPAVVVRKLDRMFELLRPSRLVTLVYALVSAAGDEVSIVNAGHCPPALIHPDGMVELLADQTAPPIGVVARSRDATSRRLMPGWTLLCYTDGVVERRGEDIGAGLARLTAQAGSLAAAPLRAALPVLIGNVADADRDEDAAALAIRRSPAGPA